MRPRSGRCRALLWARTNPRLSRRRGSNSTSASPGKGRTKAIRSDRAPQGPVAPWVAAAALSVTEATHGHHGHPGAAVLARFSGSVGTLSPNHDCCQGLSEPGTLAEVALDLLCFAPAGNHSMLQIIDDTGEDFLYPACLFEGVEVQEKTPPGCTNCWQRNARVRKTVL